MFTLPGIFLSGLLDGINPCAFTTLIFFLSYLLLLKSSKTLILKTGLVFILVSFLIYFFIGLGLMEVIRNTISIKYAAKIIYKTTGIILICFSFLSFYDAYLFFRGLASKSILQLSGKQKSFIHEIIREKIKNKNIFIASGTIAAIVSLTEFSCTGQVYLPVIMYSIKKGNNSDLFMLLIYNLGFILPLLFLFLVVYKGGSDKMISKLFNQYGGYVKISLGILFSSFALILFF